MPCLPLDAQYCSYPVQAGATVSRAKVYKFKHNDVADLERVIQKAEEEERKKRWVALRQWMRGYRSHGSNEACGRC